MRCTCRNIDDSVGRSLMKLRGKGRETDLAEVNVRSSTILNLNYTSSTGVASRVTALRTPFLGFA